MDRQVEFKAGYYEWMILLDGETIYSMGDLAEFFETGDSAEEVVGVLLEAILEYFKSERKEWPLSEEETENLSELMIKKLHYHYIA